MSFDKTFGMTYPSVLDANDGAFRLAFSGGGAPNAVKVGELIGLAGDTSQSTGPHPHWGILLTGTPAVDPFAWLQKELAP